MKKQKTEFKKYLSDKGDSKSTSTGKGRRQQDTGDRPESKRPRISKPSSGGFRESHPSSDFRERRDGSFVKISKEASGEASGGDRRPPRTGGKPGERSRSSAPAGPYGQARPNRGDQSFNPRRKEKEPEEKRFNKPTLYGKPNFSENKPERSNSAKPFRKNFTERSSEEAPRTNRFEDRDRPAGKERRGFDKGGFDKRSADKGDFNRAGFDKKNPREREERPSEQRRAGRFENAPDYRLTPKNKATSKDKSDARDKSENPGAMRLNRYISNAGICSRREADELIVSGVISVNGNIVTEMGFQVQSGDVVKYGKRVLNPEKMVYILLNKPKDYLTTTNDPEERKTVMDLIDGACKERVYPVGRLDRNTTGLLLLTNDGETAGKLTHPSGNVRKLYQAELDKPITTEDFETLQQGVTLEDGFIKPDSLGIVTPDAYVIGIEIHSGRNRIVRRMFEHLGYEVQKLDRTVFAGLDKKELPRGKWRFLTEKEVVRLRFLV